MADTDRIPPAPAANRRAARHSLEALALGDAFGERWFPLFRFREGLVPDDAYEDVRARRLPAGPLWPWTDDTAMALSLHRVLTETEHGRIDQDRLATCFARAFDADQGRGYGHGMHLLLPELLARPTDWRTLAPALFEGGGSLGNGAAMRVAPLGAWFSYDLELTAAQAELSAAVTHAHPQGIAGAVAVAIAAALSVRGELSLPAVADRTPPGPVRDGLLKAAALPLTAPPREAADLLGNGSRVRADDTVPFAVWAAARHPDDLEDALWATAEGFGDVDTTCAITGGIVGARVGVGGMPGEWLERREGLG
ncbi:ADP-ribosylglycohydrolase family protein [Streptomyces sp. NPDC048442]|uniref:ADP-ribosylglycohydrolase family protein n=1 Tax=Streptomyces sp. NPDC048442 TaxID=3154823 RepID=UPI00343DC31F